jgi:hypothetical protein
LGVKRFEEPCGLGFEVGDLGFEMFDSGRGKDCREVGDGKRKKGGEKMYGELVWEER